MDPLKPYDIFKMVVGAPRCVIADADGANGVAVPTNLADIVALVASAGGAYAPATDWRDLGAATDGSSYAHGRESEGVEIQQETGSIFEEITEVSRGFSLSMAELDPTNVQFIEVAEAIETIAAAVGKSAQKRVGLGSYSDLPAYRMALIGVRKLSAGSVVEPAPSGRTRGRLVAVALNRVTLSADETEISMEKGNLWNGSVDVTAFPEPGEAAEDAYGGWFFEDAGTIT